MPNEYEGAFPIERLKAATDASSAVVIELRTVVSMLSRARGELASAQLVSVHLDRLSVGMVLVDLEAACAKLARAIARVEAGL